MSAVAEALEAEPGQRGTRPDGGALEGLFRQELREHHSRVFFVAAVVFSPLFVLWGVFDFYLVRESWRELLLIRIIAVGAGLPLLAAMYFERSRAHVWGLGWVWCVVMNLGMLAMIPYAGASYSWYITGFLLAQIGSAAIPFWPPRYTYALLAVTTTPMVLLAERYGGEYGAAGTVSAVFFGGTFAVLGGLISRFKFGYAKESFEARARLGQTTSELEEALDRAQEVDRLKNEFFANVSHELRTPLTLILGPVGEVLARLEGSPEGEALKVVERNANRLLRMIDDLLDLAKLDAKGMTLRVAHVDVEGVAEAVAADAKGGATAKGVSIEFSAEGDPTEVFGDAHRIGIVLTNLVGNALKFTPEGGWIKVMVSHAEDGVRVAVEDNGPGIAEEEQERVFTRFHQTESSERRRAGGVGIGLALARELAVLHGGELTLESQVGRGSKFVLFLRKGLEHLHGEHLERRQGEVDVPAHRVGPAETEPVVQGFESAIAAMREGAYQRDAAMGGERRAKVLVAEDEAELRGFVVGLLSEEYDVVAAEDGAEAMRLVGEQCPDLVLTDVMMPGTSGLDLCRAMKADARLAEVPVVFLTARGETLAALECYEAGGDDFVTKPFHGKVLVARVRAQLRMRRLAAEVAELRVTRGLAGGVTKAVRGIEQVASRLEGGATSELARRLRRGVADIEALFPDEGEEGSGLRNGGRAPSEPTGRASR